MFCVDAWDHVSGKTRRRWRKMMERKRNGGNMSALSSTESRAASKICRWGPGSKFRELYIHEKDKEIIGYFRQKRDYSRRRGNANWQEMERHGVCPGRTWGSLQLRWKIHILPKLDEAVIRQLEEGDTKKENSLWKSSSSRRGFRRNDNYYTAEEDMKIVRYIVDNGGKKQTTKIKL